jgi:SAM-dependent methyltransferase
MDELSEEVRSFWDTDAATYDNASGHHPRSPAVIAAWAAALDRLLGTPPTRVLDVGAGTGFLSLIAARLGHRVTALDISIGMLERLKSAAEKEDLEVEVVVGNAADPPKAGFDSVMERHVLWTLPAPTSALGAWRASAPDGRLLLIESLWGKVDPLESLRGSILGSLRQLRGDPPDHHTVYSETLREALPLSNGTSPNQLIEMLTENGWRSPRLERLRDVEWAENSELPLPDRLLGVRPRFAVIAS